MVSVPPLTEWLQNLPKILKMLLSTYNSQKNAKVLKKNASIIYQGLLLGVMHSVVNIFLLLYVFFSFSPFSKSLLLWLFQEVKHRKSSLQISVEKQQKKISNELQIMFDSC